MTSTSAEQLYLIDAFSLIFQVFHAIPQMTSPAGLPTNALFGLTRDMLYIRKERAPTHVVVCFDAPGKTFRDEMFAEYKAQRAEMPDDLQLQMPMIEQMLEAMRVPVTKLEGFEADDLIATLAEAGAERGMEVYICSSDKDCRQLLSDRIHIFNLRKQIVYDARSLLEDWGVRPEQVVDFQTLVGDSVDNVPGVEGVGPKTAAKYLQDYQTVENLIKHIDDLKGKKKENLQAFLPNLERSRKLVTLDRHVPVKLDWDGWKVREWDGAKLFELFTSWGFRGFAQQAKASIKHAPAAPASEPATTRITQGSLFDAEGATVSTSRNAAPDDWPHVYHLVSTREGFIEFLHKLREQKRFVLDLETTSLNELEADIVGFAFCWQAGEAHYVAVRGPAGETELESDSILAELKPILEDPAVAKLNQNMKYDWKVLLRHGVRMRNIVGDSMLADFLLNAGKRSYSIDDLCPEHLGHRKIPTSELLGKGKKQITMDRVPVAQVAEYAGEDADVAWRLCELLEPRLEELRFKRRAGEGEESRDRWFLYDDLEIPLIEVLAEMETTGIRLDVPLLAEMSREMDAALTKLEAAIYDAAGRQFNINSVPQLREVLFKQLNFKPIKKTNIGGESSTDSETLEALAASDHPNVELPRRLLEHRKISKLKGTYVDALPAEVNAKTGRVHASFNQTGAATGRLSSSEPNLQNIPIRSDMGGQIRRAFIPESGWTLLSADYSQIELRLLAHFSEDPTLLQAFAENRDIHAIVAAQIYGVDVAAVTDEMRRAAKTVNFGVIYGISATGLATRLHLTIKEGAEFIDSYFQKYPRVEQYQQKLLADCVASKYVTTILGRRRRIEGVRERTTYRNRNQPEREAINMQIQGSAADLIKVAMLSLHHRFKREKLRARMLLQIHDELVFETPPDELQTVMAIVREEMTKALSRELKAPLRVDMNIGPNWHDQTEAM